MVNKYFLKYKWHLIGGIVFVSLSNLFAVFPAQSVRIAIDLVMENLKIYQEFKGTKLSTNIEDKTGLILLFFGILVIVLALFRGLFMYLMRQTIIVMSRHIEFDMKNEIYSHYQDLSLSFYRKNSTGDLMARISEDVSRVRMYVGPAIMYAINLVVTIILVLWAMFSVNTHLTWLVILPLPILSYSIFYVNNVINRKSDAIQSKLSDLTSFVQEAFSGIRVIKAFAAEKESETAFEEMGEDYRNKQLDLAKTDAVFFPLMFFLTGLSTLITIVAGGFEVLNGRASLGNIAEFVIYVNMLTWPVTSLGWTSSLVQRAAASQARINEFLNTKPEIQSTNLSEFTFNEFIQFENIGLTYTEKSEKALKLLYLCTLVNR
jgi:ATP-binding cassette subfamily B protein